MKTNMRVKSMTLHEGMRVSITDYPNFHKSGSVRGMKDKVYGKNALLVRCGDFIYCVPSWIYDLAN